MGWPYSVAGSASIVTSHFKECSPIWISIVCIRATIVVRSDLTTLAYGAF